MARRSADVPQHSIAVAAIISAEDTEGLDWMDAEQAERLDAALERMRDAFSDIPEEQLESDVVECFECVCQR